MSGVEVRNRVRMLSIYLIGVIITGATSVEISIEPRRAVLRPGDSTNVLCKAPRGVKLTSCWFYVSGREGIDLSRGRATQATDGLGYYGSGLEKGDCGISLQRVARDCATITKMATVTCAVQVEGQGWSVAYMSLLVTGEPTFHLNVEHSKMEANVGENVTILCHAPNFNLTKCLFHGRNLGRIDLSQGHRQPPEGLATKAAGRVHYFGQGLEEGDCGITLTNVTVDWNGLVWCSAKSVHDNWGYDYTTLKVFTTLQSRPDLNVSSTQLNLHDTLQATCTVKSSRPATRMIWDSPFDEGISEVYSDDILDARFDFEEKTVTQVMTKRVIPTDHLKKVRCIVTNGKRSEAAAYEQIRVRFCGIRTFRDATPLAYNGVLAKHGEFPWHVALYEKVNDEHQYRCGGSLISPKHVITAAHCIWNASITRANPASSYAVAANKFRRGWLEDSFSQRFNVTELKHHNNYHDGMRHFEDDIAIVVLSGEVEFSADVHPICLDWSATHKDSFLVHGKRGFVPGWGTTENSSLADDLRYVELPYVDKIQCREMIEKHFEQFVLADKFCAGFINESASVCRGDSGGGLTFSQNITTPNYLMGIVSISLTAGGCNGRQITGFTAVFSYYPWIKEFLDRDDPNHVLHTTSWK